MPIDDITLQALAEKHGPDIAVLEAAEGKIEMVARKPTDVQYRAFKVGFDQRGKERIEAEHQLVLLCCVHPDREDLGKLLEANPGAVEPLAIEIMEMAGAVKVTRKKVPGPSAK